MLVLLLLLTSACAGPIANVSMRLGPAPYRVGPLTVHVLTQAEVQRECTAKGYIPTPGRRIMGCFDALQNTIYTTARWDVLLHELKHYFEGEWHP